MFHFVGNFCQTQQCRLEQAARLCHAQELLHVEPAVDALSNLVPNMIRVCGRDGFPVRRFMTAYQHLAAMSDAEFEAHAQREVLQK